MAYVKNAGVQNQVVVGDLWTVFGIYPQSDFIPSAEQLQKIPERLVLDGVERQPKQAHVASTQLDLASVLGKMVVGETAFVYIPVKTQQSGEYLFGFGADWWMSLWCNGKLVFDNTKNSSGNRAAPIAIWNNECMLRLKQGDNLLVVRFVSGKSSSLLALGGPAEIDLWEKQFHSQYPQPLKTYLPGNAHSIAEAKNISDITIEKYDIFCDLQDKGYPISMMGPFMEQDGSISGYFSKSILFEYVEDVTVGSHAFVTKTYDDGKTWSEPVRVPNYGLVKNEKIETYAFCPALRTATASGTEIYIITHYGLESEPGPRDSYTLDMATMKQNVLVGRREKGQPELAFVKVPQCLDYINLEFGLQLPSGRLVLTAWGANHHENWRCGVMLSDDDGKTWRWSQVGYEPDLSIRDMPSVPAGYNEQTLFLDADGSLVSIIRGREGLGRGVPGRPFFGMDTWFFRSESRDGGLTWTEPIATNLPGTGGTCGQGIVLPDGSYLIGVRVPHSRSYYDLPEKGLFGLNLARSFDKGKTWLPQFILQRDPEGIPMISHYSVMNGFFLKRSENCYDYIFGYYEPLGSAVWYASPSGKQRVLRLRLKMK